MARTGKNRPKATKGPYTGLSGHTRVKSQLVTPSNSYDRLQLLDWYRDLLPEHLWIDLLRQQVGEQRYLVQFNQLLDRLQASVGVEPVFHGYISEFGIFPEEQRAEFLEAHGDLVREAFFTPAGRLLMGYPGFPAAWMCAPFAADAQALDRDAIATVLTESVIRLSQNKNAYVGHLRVLPFSRKVRAGKFQTSSEEHLDLMMRYPASCSDQEKRRLQQFAATTMNATMSDQYANFPWPAIFWRHNSRMVECKPLAFSLHAGAFLEESAAEALLVVSSRNAEKAFHYLNRFSSEYSCDLYAPEREEILLGLFSRLTRLYFRLCTDSSLWVQDMAGIVLRCLADTAIVFGYLARKGKPEEFTAFRSYGQGKEKLLMLHLQDTYSGARSMQGKSATEMAGSVSEGGSPEFVNIELDNWTKKSARDLAIQAGFEKYYRIVYDPSSADLHGTWMSLRESNLMLCGQPLHRFHRLPGTYEPPAYAGFVRVAQDVYKECLAIGIECLSYPEFGDNLDELLPTEDETRQAGTSAAAAGDS